MATLLRDESGTFAIAIARIDNNPRPRTAARCQGRRGPRQPPPVAFHYNGLAESGARPGELCRATIADVDWARRRIKLTEHKTANKTGEPRVIAIGKNFARTLRTAIGERTAGPIFLAPEGTAWTPANLSATHRRLRDSAGLDPTIVLYSARHRFATELLKAKTPIKDVADLMGHKRVATTEIYLHRDVAELASTQDLVPPAEPDPPATDDEGGAKKAA